MGNSKWEIGNRILEMGIGNRDWKLKMGYLKLDMGHYKWEMLNWSWLIENLELQMVN